MPTSKWEYMERCELVGKTIASIENEGVNSFTLVFTDGMKVVFDVEAIGYGLNGIALYEIMEEPQGEMFPEYIQETYIP